MDDTLGPAAAGHPSDGRGDGGADDRTDDGADGGIEPPGPADALADQLAQSAYSTMAVLNRIGAQNDLSLTQIRVLGILRDRRARMTDLAGRLGLDKSTLTGLVTRAERRGLMRRAAIAGDGRAVEVFLTDEGATLAAHLTTMFAQALAPMTGHLTPAEQRRLEGLLTRMLDGPHDRTP